MLAQRKESIPSPRVDHLRTPDATGPLSFALGEELRKTQEHAEALQREAVTGSREPEAVSELHELQAKIAVLQNGTGAIRRKS